MSGASDQGNALDVHVVFFDRDRDGRFELGEVKQALEELGFAPVVSAIVAPVLVLGLPRDVGEARQLRHDDSGALDQAGDFDEEAFLCWFEQADRDRSGTLSRTELLRSSLSLADDPTSLVASVGELQLVHLLLAEDGGLTRQAAADFMSGDLFRRLIAARS